jgi:hypothetical protein
MGVIVSISWLLCSANVAVLTASVLYAPEHHHGLSDPVVLEESIGEKGEDPITNFRLLKPMDGALETLPLTFRAEIGVDSIEGYKRHYGGKLLCVDIEGEWSGRRCSPMMDPFVEVDAIPVGNYTARAFITDAGDGAIRYFQTTDTSFRIVTEDTLAAHVAAVMGTRHGATERPKERSLLEWAVERQAFLEHVELQPSDLDDRRIHDHMSRSTHPGNGGDFLLVVGVKTAVVENFAFRQAIRETWASRDVLPRDVKVIFIGCEPVLDAPLVDTERQKILHAIAMEKQTYGDLLTDELHCRDSYADLANKVKAFLRFTAQTFPRTPFVMIADDDIYLRVDRLTEELRKEEQAQRLYIGQVWDNILGRSQTPVREAGQRYYVSEDGYPLKTYPPFAFGPHYVMSMDCVQFIAKNSNRLRGLGAADDVSVALWLLTIQVHMEHTPAFLSLRAGECDGGALSLADLSVLGMRSIHSNLIDEHDICEGFDRMAWQHGESVFVRLIENMVEIETYVQALEDTEYLLATSVISTRQKAGVKVSYHPSVETFRSYSRRVCLEARTLVENADTKPWMCRSITLELLAQVQRQFQVVENLETIGPAFLELWRHNLFVADPNAAPIIIGYSAESSYASVVFECIFKTIFESYKCPILVVPEKALPQIIGTKPDIFIFSIFDADCDPMSNSGCSEMIAHYMQQYLLSGRLAKASTLMMISGEAINTQNLDERVPLMSSVSSLARERHVYLPVASISFAERLGYSPMALLSPAPATTSQPDERRFCAYLYARWDRLYREDMFDLLNAMESVDALGVCAGSARPRDVSFQASRYHKWFNDEAVSSYHRYKFVIAFENSAEPGYVTEKLVNPFLAGSIPVYFGNSATATQLFNPDSFIDCGRFESLQDCAAYVLRVHKSPEIYERMRREPPIRNITAFNEAFSWHPSVPSQALADKVARLLGITQYLNASK